MKGTLECGQNLIKAKADVLKSKRNNKKLQTAVRGFVYLNLSLKYYELVGNSKH